MKATVSILSILPLVSLPGALVLPHLLGAMLSPRSHPRGFAIAFQLYYLSLLCVWLLTVALASMKARSQRTSQFSLKGLLGTVATAAVGLAAVFGGSVFSFVVLLLFTTGGVVWCLRVAFRSLQHDRAFCFGFSVLACIGVLWSLVAPSPITATPLARVMWWDLTDWGNGFGWNGTSFLGSQYLFLTWLAAYSGAWLASAFTVAQQGQPSG